MATDHHNPDAETKQPMNLPPNYNGAGASRSSGSYGQGGYSVAASQSTPVASVYGHSVEELPGAQLSVSQPIDGGGPLDSTQKELAALEEKGTLWLLAAAGGFFLGLGWITGPLAWYFGGKLRGRYRALGLHPAPSANWAWGLGLASTVIYVCSLVSLVVFILFVALAVSV